MNSRKWNDVILYVLFKRNLVRLFQSYLKFSLYILDIKINLNFVTPIFYSIIFLTNILAEQYFDLSSEGYS